MSYAFTQSKDITIEAEEMATQLGHLPWPRADLFRVSETKAWTEIILGRFGKWENERLSSIVAFGSSKLPLSYFDTESNDTLSS